MAARLVFGSGGICDELHESVLPLIRALREKIKFMHNLRTEDLLNYVDGLGKYWAGNSEIKRHVAENLGHLASFMSKGNTVEMLNTSLRGSYSVLDDFVELSPGKLCHAQPRGLAIHWLAGNVQILGIFSILQAMLTKNVSLIKASSRSYDGLVFLLNTLRNFDTEKIKGADLAGTMNVVLVEHDDKKNQRVMSLNADMRIVWGGAEAVDIISGLKKKFFCEDIIYGPKYSYALVDGASLEKNAADIARRFAFDISTFDQYACSSPHTIFVEQNSEFEPIKFAELLAGELDKVNRLMIPKGETDAAKVMDILNLRTEYVIWGKVFSSKNADWTVIYSEEEGFAEPCFSRVVFVRPIKDVKTLATMNDRRKQTIGLAMENSELRKKLVDEVTLFGVDRCPQPGHMTLFDSPWDGMFGVDRMVRWVTTWK